MIKILQRLISVLLLTVVLNLGFSTPSYALNYKDAIAYHRLTGTGRFEVMEKKGTLSNGDKADLVKATKVEEQPNLLSALKYAADRFENIGSNAQKIVEMSGGQINGNIAQRHPTQLEPFVYQIEVPYNDKGAKTKIEIIYQFAANSPGYIISQEIPEEGKSTIDNRLINNKDIGYAENYYTTHADTGDIPWSQMIKQDKKSLKKRNSEILDARTKLAGEGARFNVVKNNMSVIADTTRIYKVKSGKVYWVYMRDLWKYWAQVFRSRYGITNKEIATELDRDRWDNEFGPNRGLINSFQFKPSDIKIE
ncbi:hypothetical protein [Anabaena sp. PCC 7108]|uniref:hypothetical protein n=1 Tax=Anabaena sp. PCC 7108 TaxID=163908 RepID=UPI00034928A6|nr:hypothetical protein [Anabaena sp. PCC 7108]